MSLLPLASEADLVLPHFETVKFFNNSIDGKSLLELGFILCGLGLVFGLFQYMSAKRLPVHRAMLEISELIFQTCKAYLIQQGKFLLILEAAVGLIMFIYFKWLVPVTDPVTHLESTGFTLIKVIVILLFSVVGIAGSYAVAWYGIRMNTFANSRTAFASLRGKPFLTYEIPLKAGMSIGMVLISVELAVMLFILVAIPKDFSGPCFIGFAIGESLG